MARVISFGRAKEAALYFDEVFPLDCAGGGGELLSAILGRHEHDPQYSLWIPVNGGLAERIMPSLMPSHEFAIALYNKQLLAYSWLPIEAMMTSLNDNGALDDWLTNADQDAVRELLSPGPIQYDQLIDQVRAGSFNRQGLLRICSEEAFKDIALAGFDGAPPWVDSVLAGKARKPVISDDTAYALAIRHVNVVDYTKISWEKILQFREDRESRNRLKRFRVFFAENFVGKSQSYIEDRLCSALEDHNDAIKLWDFETVKKTISVATAKENAVSTSIGVLSSILLGAPVAVSAGIGSAITLAGCAVEFASVFYKKRAIRTRSNLSFLSDLEGL